MGIVKVKRLEARLFNMGFMKSCSFVILNGGETWFLHSWLTCILMCNREEMKERVNAEKIFFHATIGS